MSGGLYPIRILHVIGHMDRAGAETMIMNLYRHIDRRKIQFDFVQHYDKEAAFDQEIRQLGGKIFHCPVYKPFSHLSYVRWWNNFFETHSGQYPIVHGHIGSTAAIYLRIAKQHGSFTIAHSHFALSSSLIYQIYSYPTRWIADAFFGCGSEAITVRYGRKVLGSGKDKVIKNGIDLDQFSFSKEARSKIRAKYSIPTNATVIGHVGRFSEVKNHGFLIDIFMNFLRENSDSYLMLVGDGHEKSKIETKVKKIEITDHVVFTGIQADTSPFYSAMDLFVFPSLGEGLPVALVEAQSTSLPCLISDTIPKESALIPELIHWCSLNETAEQWAKNAANCMKQPRVDRKESLTNTGYDIVHTALELQESYFEFIKQTQEAKC